MSIYPHVNIRAYKNPEIKKGGAIFSNDYLKILKKLFIGYTTLNYLCISTQL